MSTNCYHLYPAHAAFGGYKQSGIGRDGHKMMLDHYQQTKNLLVGYTAPRRWASSDRALLGTDLQIDPRATEHSGWVEDLGRGNCIRLKLSLRS